MNKLICSNCGNIQEFKKETFTIERINNSNNSTEFLENKKIYYCSKCNTLLSNEIMTKNDLKTINNLILNQPISNKKEIKYKIYLNYQFKLKDNIYESILFTYIIPNGECSNCDAKKQGQLKLLDMIKDMKEQGLNIITISECKIETIINEY